MDDSEAVEPAARRSALGGAAGCWLAAALVYLVAEAVTASAYPGYSYAADYISDLGIPADSPRHLLINAAFIVQAPLFVAAALLTLRATRGGYRRSFLALAVTYSAGLVVIAVFHSGSGLAALHGLGAGMAILGGNLLLVVAGFGVRRSGTCARFGTFSVALGVIGIGCLAALMLGTAIAGPDFGSPGAWERAAVYPITAWEIAVAAIVLVGLRRRTAGRSRP